MGKIIYKAYKYRLYPNKEQEQLLKKHFGCCRFVYNYFLEDRIKKHEQGTNISYLQQCKDLTKLKRQQDFTWLNEVNAQSLQAALSNLDKAFQNFYNKKANHPKFKKKNTRNSFCVPTYFFLKDGKLVLPKFGRKNGIKIIEHRPIEGKLLFAKVSKSPSGKYFVSITTEQCIEPKQHPNTMVGLDLGITDLIITSTGEKFKNHKYYYLYEKNITKAHKNMKRKQVGSSNYEKQRIKFAKAHEKVHNVKTDYLHKLSRKLVDEHAAIFLEDLHIQGLLKNHCMAKAISDCSWYQFTEQLKYKGDWENVLIHKINRFSPSSKTCSICGHIEKSMPLTKREWTCPHCGTHHDRDINAAINILHVGIEELMGQNPSSGTGDYTNGGDVRPFSSKAKKAIFKEVRSVV